MEKTETNIHHHQPCINAATGSCLGENSFIISRSTGCSFPSRFPNALSLFLVFVLHHVPLDVADHETDTVNARSIRH